MHACTRPSLPLFYLPVRMSVNQRVHALNKTHSLRFSPLPRALLLWWHCSRPATALLCGAPLYPVAQHPCLRSRRSSCIGANAICACLSTETSEPHPRLMPKMHPLFQMKAAMKRSVLGRWCCVCFCKACLPSKRVCCGMVELSRFSSRQCTLLFLNPYSEWSVKCRPGKALCSRASTL